MTTEGQYDSAKLQEAIKSYLDSPTQNAALLQPITTELHNRTLKLLQLVQQLGESLTAKNEVARARGKNCGFTQIMTEIVIICTLRNTTCIK
jgi:hypothetical protein